MKDPRSYCDACHREVKEKYFRREFDLVIHSNMNSQNPLRSVGLGAQYASLEMQDVCDSCLAAIGEAIVKTINKRGKEGV